MGSSTPPPPPGSVPPVPPPPPPAGTPPRQAGSQPSRPLWEQFRNLPMWAQVTVWVLLLPVPLGLLVHRLAANRGWPAPRAQGWTAGALVFLLLLASAAADNPTTTPTIAPPNSAGSEANSPAPSPPVAGAAEMAVPDVVGLRLQVAVARIESAGFVAVVHEGDGPEPDVIVSQAPRGGTLLPNGRNVYITVAVEVEPTTKPAPAESPEPGPEPAPQPAPAPAGALVTRVIDGDTIDVKDGNREYRVRFAQVDAPETNECYGSQATNWLTQQLLSKRVKLERTTNGPDEDQYGRKVREVWLGSTSINVEIVRRGYAEHYESFSSEDPDLAQRIAAAEDSAQANGRGLWTDCAEPDPDPKPGCTPGYKTADGSCIDDHDDDGNGDVNCDEVDASAKPVQVTGSDPYGLDGDGDGIGCEM